MKRRQHQQSGLVQALFLLQRPAFLYGLLILAALLLLILGLRGRKAGAMFNAIDDEVESTGSADEASVHPKPKRRAGRLNKVLLGLALWALFTAWSLESIPADPILETTTEIVYPISAPPTVWDSLLHHHMVQQNNVARIEAAAKDAARTDSRVASGHTPTLTSAAIASEQLPSSTGSAMSTSQESNSVVAMPLTITQSQSESRLQSTQVGGQALAEASLERSSSPNADSRAATGSPPSQVLQLVSASSLLQSSLEKQWEDKVEVVEAKEAPAEALAPSAPTYGGSLWVGATAQVTGTESCLNSRAEPGSDTVYTCLPENFVATIVDGPLHHDGQWWWRLDSYGWSSDDYLSIYDGSRPAVSNGFAWPIDGPITDHYGVPRGHTRHAGLDIGMHSGRSHVPIRAAASGTVVMTAYEPGGYGRFVIIDHGNGFQTLYAHMSSIAVPNRRYVSQGEAIGYTGCTGLCTGEHLHFEIRKSGATVNSLHFLS